MKKILYFISISLVLVLSLSLFSSSYTVKAACTAVAADNAIDKRLVGKTDISKVFASKPKINKVKLTLNEGQTYRLKVTGMKGSIKWSTNNKKVVKVSSKGVVTGLQTGTAKVYAKNGKSTVYATIKVNKVSLTYTSIKMTIGARIQLKLKGTSYPVTFKSNNTKIATITNTGTITAKSTGSTVISAKANKKTYRCTIHVINSHVHSYTSIITTQPTCTANGVRTYTCSCGENYLEEIPAKGHDPVTEVLQKPTCTSTGIERTYCKTCNLILSSKEDIPKTEHKSSDWITKYYPSCTKTGVEYRKCLDCDEILEERTTPTIDHTNQWDVDEDNSKKVKECIFCGKEIESYPITMQTITIELKDGETDTVTGFYDERFTEEVYTLLNELRDSKGLEPLAKNLDTVESAKVRTAEIGWQEYHDIALTHERPNGQRGYTVNALVYSENIAYGFTSPEGVMQGWKDSNSHYKAMVSPIYESVAISCFQVRMPEGYYITCWVQLFTLREEERDDNYIILE